MNELFGSCYVAEGQENSSSYFTKHFYYLPNSTAHGKPSINVHGCFMGQLSSARFNLNQLSENKVARGQQYMARAAENLSPGNKAFKCIQTASNVSQSVIHYNEYIRALVNAY